METSTQHNWLKSVQTGVWGEGGGRKELDGGDIIISNVSPKCAGILKMYNCRLPIFLFLVYSKLKV